VSEKFTETKIDVDDSVTQASDSVSRRANSTKPTTKEKVYKKPKPFVLTPHKVAACGTRTLRLLLRQDVKEVGEFNALRQLVCEATNSSGFNKDARNERMSEGGHLTLAKLYNVDAKDTAVLVSDAIRAAEDVNSLSEIDEMTHASTDSDRAFSAWPRLLVDSISLMTSNRDGFHVVETFHLES
jgi:hypothetical protein